MIEVLLVGLRPCCWPPYLQEPFKSARMLSLKLKVFDVAVEVSCQLVCCSWNVCAGINDFFFVLVQQRTCLTAHALRAQFARSIEADVLCFFLVWTECDFWSFVFCYSFNTQSIDKVQSVCCQVGEDFNFLLASQAMTGVV